MECTVELTLKDTKRLPLLEPACNLLTFTVAPKVLASRLSFLLLKPLTLHVT